MLNTASVVCSRDAAKRTSFPRNPNPSCALYHFLRICIPALHAADNLPKLSQFHLLHLRCERKSVLLKCALPTCDCERCETREQSMRGRQGGGALGPLKDFRRASTLWSYTTREKGRPTGCVSDVALDCHSCSSFSPSPVLHEGMLS